MGRSAGRTKWPARRSLIAGAALLAAGGWAVLDFTGREGEFSSQRAERSIATLESRSAATEEEQPASINPLSGLSLDALKQTVERPLFNASRIPKPKPIPQVSKAEEEPESGPGDFTLLAVVVTAQQRTALLRLNKTSEVLRLKAGERFAEWTVRDIQAKTVVIGKDDLVLPLELFTQPSQPSDPAVAEPATEADGGEAEAALSQQAAGAEQ